MRRSVDPAALRRLGLALEAALGGVLEARGGAARRAPEAVSRGVQDGSVGRLGVDKVASTWSVGRALSTAAAVDTAPLLERIGTTFGAHTAESIKPWLPQYAASVGDGGDEALDTVVREHMLSTRVLLDKLSATMALKAEVIADSPMDAAARGMLEEQLAAFPVGDLKELAALQQCLTLADWQDLIEATMSHMRNEPTDAFARKTLEVRLRGKLHFFLRGAPAPHMGALLGSAVTAMPAESAALLRERWTRVGDAEMRRVLDALLKYGDLRAPEGAPVTPMPYVRARVLQALSDLYPDAAPTLAKRTLAALDKLPDADVAQRFRGMNAFGSEAWRSLLATLLVEDGAAAAAGIPRALDPTPLGSASPEEASLLASHLVAQLRASAGDEVAERTAPLLKEAVAALPTKRADALRALAAEGVDATMPAGEAHDLVGAVLSARTPAAQMDAAVLAGACDAVYAALQGDADDAYVALLQKELPGALAARSAFEVRDFVAWLDSASAAEVKDSVSELLERKMAPLAGLEDAVIRGAMAAEAAEPTERAAEAGSADVEAATAPAPADGALRMGAVQREYVDPMWPDADVEALLDAVLERYALCEGASPSVLAALERKFVEYPASVLVAELSAIAEGASAPAAALPPPDAAADVDADEDADEAPDAALQAAIEYFAGQPAADFVDGVLDEDDRLGWVAAKIALAAHGAAAKGDEGVIEATKPLEASDLGDVQALVRSRMAEFGADMFRRDVLVQLDEEPEAHAIALYKLLVSASAPPSVADMRAIVDWKVDTLPVDYDLLRAAPEEVFAQLEAMLGEEDPLPPLEDIYADAVNEEASEREARRLRELAKEVERANVHIRARDAYGRAAATGKRKTAAARVWLQRGGGAITVNGEPLGAYFSDDVGEVAAALRPLEATGGAARYDVHASVRGGGTKAQAGALRHGIARALVAYDPLLRPILRKEGLLTRDRRMVERKKPGRRGARRAFQWVKR